MKNFFLLLLFPLFSQAQTCDILITNGKIMDGTGNNWYYGSVAIKDGKIIGEFRPSGLRPYTLEKARQFGFDQAYLEACL